MSYLTGLTPAHNMLLLQGDKAEMRPLMKATLMDLLRRDVLRFEWVQRSPSQRDTPRRYKYVMCGRGFAPGSHHPHEEVFLGAYRYRPNALHHLKNIVQMAVAKADGPRNYRRLVLTSGPLNGMLHRPLGFLPLRPTAIGSAARQALTDELRRKEKELQEVLSNDPRAAASMISALGGHMLLFPHIVIADHHGIDQALREHMQRERSESGGCGTGCSSWDSAFDSGFDSGAGCSGASGCGGDGGSGCSGCGGCSGCS